MRSRFGRGLRRHRFEAVRATCSSTRVLTMAHGRVVADGPPTEIKAKVGQRTIRVTLPDVAVADLVSLAGVTAVDAHGDAALLVCADSDVALRALLDRYPDARDIEVRGAGLDEAFLELTGDADDEYDPGGGSPR